MLPSHTRETRIQDLKAGDQLAGSGSFVVACLKLRTHVARDGRSLGHKYILTTSGHYGYETEILYAVGPHTYTTTSHLGHHPDGRRHGCRCHEEHAPEIEDYPTGLQRQAMAMLAEEATR